MSKVGTVHGTRFYEILSFRDRSISAKRMSSARASDPLTNSHTYFSYIQAFCKHQEIIQREQIKNEKYIKNGQSKNPMEDEETQINP